MQAAGTKKTRGINAYRQAIVCSVTNFLKERFMVYTKYGRFFSWWLGHWVGDVKKKEKKNFAIA